ncbi:protein of unknown function DUF59 [Parafrankia sp. EAN1pec]|uniref:metal-sulfur cluster assembly factor n=1 Tax=Parafrankia sp. (strain EAN1pec) TaxID=298653 RepID=UPI0000541442|nr:protein of unknown function DUF59 [Frankia sp. EAN1pec]
MNAPGSAFDNANISNAKALDQADELGRAVDTALRSVFDPCSVRVGAPMNIVDMGLVTSVEVGGAGQVDIAVRTTSPMCTLVASIMQGVEREVRAVPGVAAVSVRIDPRSDWTEAQISGEGRVTLELRRARSQQEVPVRPREWERRVVDATKRRL